MHSPVADALHGDVRHLNDELRRSIWHHRVQPGSPLTVEHGPAAMEIHILKTVAAVRKRSVHLLTPSARVVIQGGCRQETCCRLVMFLVTAEAGRRVHRSTDATGCTDEELFTPRNSVAAYSAPAMLNTSLMLVRLRPTCTAAQHGNWRQVSAETFCRSARCGTHCTSAWSSTDSTTAERGSSHLVCAKVRKNVSQTKKSIFTMLLSRCRCQLTPQ
jgi:hypothetical protein